MSRRQLLGLFGCGTLLFALTGAGLQAQAAHNIDCFAVVALAQGAVYALAAWLVWRGAGSRRALAVIIGFALAMRVVVVLAPPYLSSDIYRYIWDGRVIAAGINPYKYVPDNPRLAALRDAAIYPKINRRTYARTIYPPAAETIFFLVTRLGESPTAMKLAMVAFEAAAIAVMLYLLAAAGRPATWIAVYAWHPLPLWEFAGSGHIDAAMILIIAVALWTRRPWLTGLGLAGATLVKLYPAVIWPALWHRWEWRMPTVFGAAIVLAYLPFAGAGIHVFGFLPHYAGEEGLTSGAGFYWWNLAKSVVPLGASNLPYIAAAGVLLAALAAWVAFRGRGPNADVRGAALLAASFTVLLTPHYAWYFSWLVVFACLIASPALLWLTAASFVLYLVPPDWPHVIWDRQRLVAESALYVPFVILAAGELRRCRREPASDDEHAVR